MRIKFKLGLKATMEEIAREKAKYVSRKIYNMLCHVMSSIEAMILLLLKVKE